MSRTAKISLFLTDGERCRHCSILLAFLYQPWLEDRIKALPATDTVLFADATTIAGAGAATSAIIVPWPWGWMRRWWAWHCTSASAAASPLCQNE